METELPLDGRLVVGAGLEAAGVLGAAGVEEAAGTDAAGAEAGTEVAGVVAVCLGFVLTCARRWTAAAAWWVGLAGLAEVGVFVAGEAATGAGGGCVVLPEVVLFDPPLRRSATAMATAATRTPEGAMRRRFSPGPARRRRPSSMGHVTVWDRGSMAAVLAAAPSLRTRAPDVEEPGSGTAQIFTV
jgi:hypothetical protein